MRTAEREQYYSPSRKSKYFPFAMNSANQHLIMWSTCGCSFDVDNKLLRASLQTHGLDLTAEIVHRSIVDAPSCPGSSDASRVAAATSIPTTTASKMHALLSPHN